LDRASSLDNRKSLVRSLPVDKIIVVELYYLIVFELFWSIMSKKIIPADRQDRILKMIRSRGVVKIDELSKIFDVSVLTIRRDLFVLEKKGLVERTHGGALLSQNLNVEAFYSEKDRKNVFEKEAIAREVVKYIDENTTVFINSGSTSRQILRQMSEHNGLIITNNVTALIEAQNKDYCNLVLTGGEFRFKSNSLIGRLAKLSLEQVYASTCILGVDGVSYKYGFTTNISEEVEMNRCMIEKTRGSVIVVADHDKIGVVANFLTADLKEVDMLITDDGMNEEYRIEIENLGVKVIIAPVIK